MFSPGLGYTPQGALKGIVGSDIKMLTLTNVSTYTVPAGKVLAVHSLSGFSTVGFTADGVLIYSNIPNSGFLAMMDKYRMAMSVTFPNMPTPYEGSDATTNTAGPQQPAIFNASADRIIHETADFLDLFKAGVVLASNSSVNVYLFGTLHDAV